MPAADKQPDEAGPRSWGWEGTYRMVNSEHGRRTAAALLERIVDAPSNLVIVDTGHSDELIDECRLLARRSGQAVYLWHPDVGLRSMREGDLQVQGSQRLADSLRFIRRSMHFGIYLMQVEVADLSPQHINLLVDIGRLKDGPSRRVALLGHNPSVEGRLDDVSVHLNLSAVDPGTPRLRDGRWVR